LSLFLAETLSIVVLFPALVGQGRSPGARASEPAGPPSFVPGYFALRFAGPVSGADRSWLDERTGPVTRADGTPLARLTLAADILCAWVSDEAELRDLQAHASVSAVARFEPHWKLAPELGDASRGATLALEVDLVPGHPATRVSAELASLGISVREHVEYRGQGVHDLSFLVVEAQRRDLPSLARVEGVRWIAPRGPEALDARGAAELARDAWQGAVKCTTGAYDARARLLDLLACDQPARLLTLTGRPEDAPQGQPKNVLLFPSPGGEQRFVRSGPGQSSALQRALALHAGATGTDPERAVLEFDVPPARGFMAADAPGQSYRFRALAGEPVALTLAWTDEPGRIGAAPELVNDLDLVVTAPDGERFRRRMESGRGGLRGIVSEPFLAAEHFVAPAGVGGTWHVTVEPVRGSFARAQGYALVASGLEFAPEPARLEIPATVTLRPIAGLHSKDGNVDGASLALVHTSDDQRFVLRDRASVTFSFEALVPPGALLQALRVLVEHHEQPRVGAGDIQWRLGHGSSAAPTIVATTAAPLRSGPAAEGLDVWSPGVLVPNANDLELVLQNANQDDDTLLDRVAIEVDYLLSDSAPVITSLPNLTATVGQAYLYDSDGRAQATSATTLTWSLVRGPAGFTIASTTGQVAWTPSAAGSFAVTLRATNASGFAEQSFTLVAGTQPTVPATIVPANASALVYLPSERLALGAAKSQQRLNVFLPPGTAPLGGWPVVLNNRAGGGLAMLPLGALQDTGATAPLHAFVANGIAVVDFGVTGIGNGQGLFYPPGHASGRYESFRPGDDNPEKDAEWALQWLKTQASFPLSRTNICLRGSSQGAILALWCAAGPERARLGGSAQVRASTKVKGVLALQPPTSNWAFDQDPTFSSNMISHYEQAAVPGVAATSFRQVAESLQKSGSVMGFAFASPEARAWNEAQALCLIYNEPVMRIGGAVADLTLDAAGYPRLRDALGVPFVHDSWSGYVLFRRLLDLSASAGTFHRANSLFAVRDTTALPAPQNWHTHAYAGTITGGPALALAHQWVLRTLGVAPR
jgi:hypothetical protein